MDHEQLSKYFAGELTPEETESLLTSLCADKEQLEEAAKLKNSWAAAQLTITPADKETARQGWQKFRTTTGKQKNHRRLWWRVAAAAILVGAIIVASFYTGYRFHSEDPLPVAYHTLSVPAGQYAQLILSDGSEIWLNSRSKLVYPERFTTDTREVQFEGEGFFKVASDKEHPFVVKTELMDMIATGTQFNISAYPDDSWVATSLLEGVVNLHSETIGINYEVKAGQKAVYDKVTRQVSNDCVDAGMLVSWTHGEFQFKEMPLADIAKRLERNFNVVFVFDDELIKQRKFTGTFYNHQSIETILRIIKTSTKMQYQVEKDTIHIRNGK